MSLVYIINVGANTSHTGKARSPIFGDGSWVYVSFPTRHPYRPGYSLDARPFIRGVSAENTHADPSWEDLSYGDNCSNPRALALKKVRNGDILLFWGLLWRNGGKEWSAFTGERGWYLLGALRVEEIAVPGQAVQQVTEPNRSRAGRNAHFVHGAGILPKHDWVWLGTPRYSRKFSRAVDLAVASPSGLMYTAFTSSKGVLLTRDAKPSWRSSLRTCRKVCDLNDPADRARAEIVRKEILTQSNFDLLEDL